MSDNAAADMLQLLIVREAVRVQAEILQATGWPAFLIASEMMTQALVIAVPGVAVDDARKMTLDFWEAFLTDVQAKVKAGSGALPGGMLPFARRPAPAKNDEAALGRSANSNRDSRQHGDLSAKLDGRGGAMRADGGQPEKY